MRNILILNGPNLNLLGEREPGLYGELSLGNLEKALSTLAETLSLQCIFKQSNHEGTLVDIIQEYRHSSAGIILNPGAYTHTSIAIRDALSAYKGFKIEVHISNIHAREAFRHHSMIAPVCDGQIAGLGTDGYLLALRKMATLLS